MFCMFVSTPKGGNLTQAGLCRKQHFLVHRFNLEIR